MVVPFCDLARENTALLPELMAATERVLRSGRVLYGAELEAFEAELCAFTGARYAVGVASGTDAVEIALRCVNAKRVRLPAFAPVPCVNAVEAAGASPVLEGGYHTRLDVPLFGQPPASFGNDVSVLDAAHCFGRAIAVDDHIAVACSFYPSKNLGACGDGGAILTNVEGVAQRARTLRHYGVEAPGQVLRGQNSRMSELQAAYLRVKLPHVDEWNERRHAIAMHYANELSGKVEFYGDHDLPDHVFHCYVITHPERDRIRAALTERGIGTMIHYDKAIHQHPRWSHLGYPGQFPEAEEAARTVLSLPCYPYLTDAEQDAVIAAVKECV